MRHGIAAALGGCVLAAGMLGVGGGVQASAASCLSTYGRVAVPGQTADWQVVQSTKPSEAFNAVVSAVAGPSNLWLFVCGGGAALHYQGGAWTSVPLPAGTPASMTAATAYSASDVWAFAGNRVLFYNGHRWALTGQLGGQVYAASAAGPSNVWATSFNTLWHYTGRSWTRIAAPFTLTSLSAPSSGGVWATGLENTTPVVAHWTGTSWTITSVSQYLRGLTNEFCRPGVSAIYAQSAGNVWVAGGSGCQDNGGHLTVVLHWNGSSWTALSYKGSAGQPSSMVPDGSGGLWISTVSGAPGIGGMVHVAGGQVSTVALPKLDGVTPTVTLQAARGGGPVFGSGFYFTVNNGIGEAGSVVIKVR
jgi:hypothetical protein